MATVISNNLRAWLPISPIAEVTKPIIINGTRKPNNCPKRSLKVTKNLTNGSPITNPNRIPSTMAINTRGNKPILENLLIIHMIFGGKDNTILSINQKMHSKLKKKVRNWSA
jgi:hypothetical protein